MKYTKDDHHSVKCVALHNMND